MSNPLFYAKILLFGEYGIIEDSQGLTLPYSFYKGTLKFSALDTDALAAVDDFVAVKLGL